MTDDEWFFTELPHDQHDEPMKCSPALSEVLLTQPYRCFIITGIRKPDEVDAKPKGGFEFL